MTEEWLHCFKELIVPHTDKPDLINTLGDPVKIRSWQVSPLSADPYFSMPLKGPVCKI